MVYFIWEIVIIILNRLHIKKKQLLILSFSFLWIIMSLRSLTMGVSDVMGVYYPAFLKSRTMHLTTLLRDNGLFNEPIFNTILWLFSRIFNSYRLFLSFMSIITTYSIYRFIIKNSKDIVISTLIYFSFFYFYQSFLIKQMLAVSVILFAYDSLFERNFLKYIILVLVAGFIHKSSFILIILYFLCDNLKFNKNFFILTIVGLCLAIFGKDIMLNLLYKFSFYRFDVYLKNGIYGLNGSMNFSMFLYIVLIFSCYSMLKGHMTRKINDYFIISIIGCILNTRSIVVVEFYRFSIYFLIILCLLIPEAINTIKNKYRKLIYDIFVVFLCIYAFKIAYNCNCLPYRTFLFDKEIL